MLLDMHSKLRKATFFNASLPPEGMALSEQFTSRPCAAIQRLLRGFATQRHSTRGPDVKSGPRFQQIPLTLPNAYQCPLTPAPLP